MLIIGWVHITLLLLAYIIYFLITLKSFSGSINYRLLTFTNIVYIVGFVLGMIWAKIAWGFYINLDIKNILSVAVVIPFFIENMGKTKKFYLPLTGSLLIVLNYVIPLLIGTIHSH